MLLNGENKVYKIKGAIYHCGTAVTMGLIGGKWKCIILWYLRHEKMRFSELKRMIPDITEKTLSLQLKALQNDGLIHRKVQGKKPPLRVEYSLSALGKTLVPVIAEITNWGIDYAEKSGSIINKP